MLYPVYLFVGIYFHELCSALCIKITSCASNSNILPYKYKRSINLLFEISEIPKCQTTLNKCKYTHIKVVLYSLCVSCEHVMILVLSCIMRLHPKTKSELRVCCQRVKEVAGRSYIDVEASR